MKFVKRYLPKTISGLFKIVLAVVFIFPFLWMISNSIKTYQETLMFPPKLLPAVPQWQNFKVVWESGPYPTYFKNSIIVVVAIIVLQTLVMVPAAYAFARYRFKLKGICWALVMAAFMVPGQLTFITVYIMMADWNLLQTLWPQIIPFGCNAFGIFMMRQAFMQVPEEIIESARLDNGSEMSILFKIMLPMAKSSLVALIMFAFISHWNDYFWPFVMTTKDHVRPLTIGIARLRDIEGNDEWEIIMAGNTLLVAPIMVVYLFFSKKIINAFVYSGIK